MYVRRMTSKCRPLLVLTISSVFFAAHGATAQAGGQASPDALRAACAEDAQKLCAGVQPGGGRIVSCLKEHKDSLVRSVQTGRWNSCEPGWWSCCRPLQLHRHLP